MFKLVKILNGRTNQGEPVRIPCDEKTITFGSALVLLDGDEENVLEFLCQAQKTECCTILCYDDEVNSLKRENLIPIGKKNDLKKQAETLFAALRQANTHDTKIIYAHLPTKEGLGLALYNRLIRAAAHTIKKI